MLVQMDDKKLEKQNRYVMKLIDLMREHPNLPVMAMVDSVGRGYRTRRHSRHLELYVRRHEGPVHAREAG